MTSSGLSFAPCLRRSSSPAGSRRCRERANCRCARSRRLPRLPRWTRPAVSRSVTSAPRTSAGRVSVIVGVPGNPFTFYVAGANGGVFKTVNGGTTESDLRQPERARSARCAGAVEPPTSSYVGTGEENLRNNARRSATASTAATTAATVDARRARRFDRIARIRIDSRNPDVVYACALGHEWGPNDQRGVFKTTDGGRNRQRASFKDTLTGCPTSIRQSVELQRESHAGMHTSPAAGGGTCAAAAWRDGALQVDGRRRDAEEADERHSCDADRVGVAIARSSPNIARAISETPNYEGELVAQRRRGASWRVVYA